MKILLLVTCNTLLQADMVEQFCNTHAIPFDMRLKGVKAQEQAELPLEPQKTRKTPVFLNGQRLTAAHKRSIRSLYATGKGYREIARATGWSDTTVRKVIAAGVES